MAPTRARNARVFWGLAVVAAVGIGNTARAAAIRYEYGGTVTSTDPSTGTTPGGRFSGTFTYDPTPSTPNASVYAGMNPDPTASGLTFSVGSKLLFSEQKGVGLSVQQTAPFDRASVPIPGRTELTIANLNPMNDSSLHVNLNLSNPGKAVFAALDKPLPLNLGDFTTATLNVTDRAGKTLYGGTVDTLKIVPIPFGTPDPVPVPEPAALASWLALAGAAILAGRARARRKRTD